MTTEPTSSIDETFKRQLDQMSHINSKSLDNFAENTADMRTWRLNSAPFYFKFCERIPHGISKRNELIPGFIIHHSHVRHALEHFTGQAEERKYTTVDETWRHLSNSQFVDLAKYGWIGSGSAGTSVICDIVRENRRTGRQLTVASISGPQRRTKRTWSKKVIANLSDFDDET